MAQITQLVAQKKNNERISVFVDDEFFCGLKVDDVISNNLSVGLELTEAELSNLLSNSGENDMFGKALVYILKNPRTETEVARFLKRKECSAEMVANIIGRLKTMNYINDEAYAKMFAVQKHIKMSVRAIKYKLRTKGIAGAIADEATEEHLDEGETAGAIAEKYMRGKDSDEKTLQRLYRYLAGKGFDYDMVSEIVANYRTKRELDPETKAEFVNRYADYCQARLKVAAAKREAANKKKDFKVIRKKVVSGSK